MSVFTLCQGLGQLVPVELDRLASLHCCVLKPTMALSKNLKHISLIIHSQSLF